MKKFIFPYISDIKSNIFDLTQCCVVPIEQNKFIVNFRLNDILRHKNIFNCPIYIVGEELTEFMVYFPGKYGDILKGIFLVCDDERSDFQIYITSRENERLNTLYINPTNGSIKSINEFSKPYTRPKSFLEIRKDNIGLISGFSKSSAKEFLLNDYEISQNEIAILNFHGNSYEVRIVDFATYQTGKVISLDISNDGLTGCALIAYELEKWEVVVFDL